MMARRSGDPTTAMQSFLLLFCKKEGLALPSLLRAKG
jgi:hypothetical protein